jgi:dihydroxy-acid dehydratase
MALDPRHRSRTLFEGKERAPARSYLKGIGFTDEDLSRPIVGIANTWIGTMPCNYNLRALAQKVMQGVGGGRGG